MENQHDGNGIPEAMSQEAIRKKKKALRKEERQKQLESWDAMRSRINDSKGGK